MAVAAQPALAPRTEHPLDDIHVRVHAARLTTLAGSLAAVWPFVLTDGALVPVGLVLRLDDDLVLVMVAAGEVSRRGRCSGFGDGRGRGRVSGPGERLR